MTDLITKLDQQINGFSASNSLAEAYYEGNVLVFNPRISVPPIMQTIQTVVGWPGTVVDVLEERLDFLGWDDDGKYDLEKLYTLNNMGNESSLTSVDTLVHGVSFYSISTGNGPDDDGGAIILAESPKYSTGIWNRSKRRLDVGFTKYRDEEGKLTKAALFEENRTVYYRRANESAPWVVVKVDNHRLGRCMLVRKLNKGRAGRMSGRSEITPAIRSYTNTAVRTLLGMETNREFFQAPQRYALGAKQDAFVDQDGNQIPGWKAIMGGLWTLQRDAEWAQDHPNSDGLPQVGQFPTNPPGPFLEQIRGLSLMVCAESGMPPAHLGFATDNPPSADAIRALESRLVKRAERRQDGWDPTYLEVATVATLITKGKLIKPEEVETLWRDPSTPTKAADADRASKLVGAGIIPADSDVARELAGLSRRQIKRLKDEAEEREMDDLLREGMSGVPSNQPPAPVNGQVAGEPVAEPAQQ